MFDSLLSKIAELEVTPVAADSPHMLEQTVGRYNQYVAGQLTAIMQSAQTDDNKLDALEDYLLKNWNVIKGTVMSQTNLTQSSHAN